MGLAMVPCHASYSLRGYSFPFAMFLFFVSFAVFVYGRSVFFSFPLTHKELYGLAEALALSLFLSFSHLLFPSPSVWFFFLVGCSHETHGCITCLFDHLASFQFVCYFILVMATASYVLFSMGYLLLNVGCSQLEGRVMDPADVIQFVIGYSSKKKRHGIFQLPP
jgi:hypothetical protein